LQKLKNALQFTYLIFYHYYCNSVRISQDRAPRRTSKSSYVLLGEGIAQKGAWVMAEKVGKLGIGIQLVAKREVGTPRHLVDETGHFGSICVGPLDMPLL
jgi:hypothetical protein